MRLLPSGSTSSASVETEASASSADIQKKRGRPRKDDTTETPSKPQGGSKVPEGSPALAIDYTRPSTSTELLMDLQRRVIALEEYQTRKLTAGEYAIAVQLMTGNSLESLTKNGYVVEKCPCESRLCKGWRLVPVVHYRSTDQTTFKDTSEVKPMELKDLTPKDNGPIDPIEEAPLGFIFNKMFEDGLLKKNKKEQTLIPDDGPITWTHRQQLAFAHGFDMEDLLALEGKPRELQRQLIANLREIGYTNILSSPPTKEKK